MDLDDDNETLLDEMQEERRRKIIGYLLLLAILVGVVLLVKAALSWSHYREAVATCQDRPGLWPSDGCRSREECVERCALNLRDGTSSVSGLTSSTKSQRHSVFMLEAQNGIL